jgi:hypothetical protein
MELDGMQTGQAELVAQINQVPVSATKGIHTTVQHEVFQRAYRNLNISTASTSATLPTDKKLLQEYKMKIELEKKASEEQKEGHIDDTDSFVRFHSVVENDIKKYKATAKAGAQAKLNATHSGIDMRNGLFDNIQTGISKNQFGHTAVPGPFQHDSSGPLDASALLEGAVAPRPDPPPAQAQRMVVQRRVTAPPVANAAPAPAATTTQDAELDEEGHSICLSCMVANGLKAQQITNLLTLQGPACITASMPNFPKYLAKDDPTHNRKTCPNDIRRSQDLSEEETLKLRLLRHNIRRLLKRRLSDVAAPR